MTTLTNNEAQRKRHWLADNRGALTQIAREQKLSVVFVGDVFWGNRASRSGSVERSLAALGAPGFQAEPVEGAK